MSSEAREPDDDAPDLTRITAGLSGPIGAIAIASVGLFLLAAFYTLYFGREFFLPIAVAVLLNFLLTPPVRALKRLGIAAPVGACVMLVLFSAPSDMVHSGSGPRPWNGSNVPPGPWPTPR